MPLLFWDASGLVKRFAYEQGTATVNALFAVAPSLTMRTTDWGYAETCAVLRRKLNRGSLNPQAFAAARLSLRREVLDAPEFGVLPLESPDVMAGVTLVDRHNLNTADAATLTLFLRYAQNLSEPCVLVAADTRLLRAASAEGLAMLNPELLPAADVAAFLLAL